jgi:hypothetical protein
MSIHEDNDLLRSKLNEFVRKYYLNRMIRGVVGGLGAVTAYFLIATFAEYFGHFGTGVRTALFYSFLIFTSTTLIFWICIPLR